MRRPSPAGLLRDDDGIVATREIDCAGPRLILLAARCRRRRGRSRRGRASGDARRQLSSTRSKTGHRRAWPRAATRSAAPVLEALADGQLLSSGADKRVASQDAADGDLLDAATGSARAADGRAGCQAGHASTTALRRALEAALGSLRCSAPTRRPAQRRRRGRASISRDRRAAALEQALAPRSRPRHRSGARTGPRRGRCSISADAPRPTASRPSSCLPRRQRPRRPRTCCRPPGSRCRHGSDRRARPPPRRGHRQARAALSRSCGLVQNAVLRHQPRLGAAARRDRARHHLRRDGRHQHGAWRDGDARRLHDLRRAGALPHHAARPCSTGRCSIALPLAFLVAGAVGMRHRARHHPLPLRPAAGDAARHLGPVADPAAGGAHRSSAPTTARSATPSWMSGLARPIGRPDDHLQPAVDRRVRAGRVRACMLASCARRRFGLEMRAVTQNRRMAAARWASARRGSTR